VQEVHKVIPIHQTVHKVHEHHQKAAPVVLEHKGWAQPAHSGWAPEESSGGGGYAGGHGAWERRADVNVEESAPVVTIVKAKGDSA